MSLDNKQQKIYDFVAQTQFSILPLPRGFGKSSIAFQLAADTASNNKTVMLIVNDARQTMKTFSKTIDQSILESGRLFVVELERIAEGHSMAPQRIHRIILDDAAKSNDERQLVNFLKNILPRITQEDTSLSIFFTPGPGNKYLEKLYKAMQSEANATQKDYLLEHNELFNEPITPGGYDMRSMNDRFWDIPDDLKA